MSSTDELRVRETRKALDTLNDLLGLYAAARDRTRSWVDGYATRTPGHGESTAGPRGNIARPTETAALANVEGNIDRADALNDELAHRLRDLDNAVHAFIEAMTFARRIGAAGGRPNKCEEPSGCTHVADGLNGDRLVRFRGQGPRLCRAHYKAHERAAEAAGLTEFAHTTQEPE